ncbi:MAG: hypothetical protein A3H49_06620 [Nitrospirae bacterium RIFCSPLOWO2_02_FULL_62_14]|nr:MAG: hypothetical protein A3H49_06620 [Nitrospirae bacterium RIFCSPLOWO2_02_FULL_62_14]
MSDHARLTPEEIALVADDKFFRAKAAITPKVRAMLEAVHDALKQELAGVPLIAPPGFDPDKCQYVKGEHLEDFPYQYLDFPKHFEGDNKFTFRTLFWWGHHVVFALILEGDGLRSYKQNLINRYGRIADRDLDLCLSPTPWEWKWGQGYTLSLSRDRKSEVAAVLSNRPFFKLARFISLDDPIIRQGRLSQAGQEALRAVLPVIARDLPGPRS